MDTNSSKTAQYMALFRALESQRPASERLFEDRLAFGFLSLPLYCVARLAHPRLLGEVPARFIDQRWPGARSAGVARTRFIDDALNRAVAQGIRQIAVLGAGYDTRAQRLPSLAPCRVFELDRPATQQAKRRRLQAASQVRPNQVFVPVDLAHTPLLEALDAHGFDRAAPTFFLWEGVTNYLSAEAVDTTLRAIAACAAGSQLLFTYIHRGVLEGDPQFPVAHTLTSALERAGERWTFGIDPAQICDYLAQRGFELLDDCGVSSLRDRYFGSNRFSGYEFYRLAQARVR